MPKAIQDEFTALPLCHQRKYQLRMQRDGRCIICGKPAVSGFRCQFHVDKSKTYLANSLKKNPLKNAAWRAVTNALATGAMTRQPCEVCGELAQAHHEDYSKPLDVRWLCHTHHCEAHGQIAHSKRAIKIPDYKKYQREYHKTYKRKMS